MFTMMQRPISILAVILVTTAVASAQSTVSPLRPAAVLNSQRAISLELDRPQLDALWQTQAARAIALPLPDGSTLTLKLTPFQITTPATRFVRASPTGQVATKPPEVLLLHGDVPGIAGSHAFLAISASGMTNGYVRGPGVNYTISTALTRERTIAIQESSADTGLPDFPDFCGVGPAPHAITQPPAPRGSPESNRGPRIANVAVDSDQSYFGIFGDFFAPEEYIIQLIAAVSDIYERDLNLRLNLVFSRVWPAGGEPFDANDLGSFANHWSNDEDMTGLNFVHLFSGRRDLGYGGVAYLGGTCQSFAFGISGFLLGSFPSPLGQPSLGNWDVIVCAHEMGHNAGTLHTHDGYSPTIDDCGNGVPSRGTIMGYCHIHPGGTSNTDLYMHRRVEDVIETELSGGGCLAHDCNDNLQNDAIDIANLVSLDTNADGIPDECQDCNSNGILDPTDIINGAPDINGNSIPDICEPDCNANGIPDPYECDLNPAQDVDGNNIPDACDPDCNSNGVIDWTDTNTGGGFTDVDRDATPDVCQDCNANGLADWIDLGRPQNLFVADRSNYVREYYRTTGYPIQNYGASVVLDPLDCAFGPDRQLYVASAGNDRIVKINVDIGAAVPLVNTGQNGLDGPSALAFGPDGHIYVAATLSGKIMKFHWQTGALLAQFTAPGAFQPVSTAFDPGGKLVVGSVDNRIIEFDVNTGVPSVIIAGAGIDLPRGLAFLPNGNLLVASFNTDQIREYNGVTHAFVRNFNGLVDANGVWGLRIGPNGNVFAVRGLGTIRVLEFRPDGLLLRSFVRGDALLPAPTGIAFRPGAIDDCNNNFTLDRCEPGWTDTPAFTEALLSAAPDPALTCLYDRNHDGQLNAADIQPYTADLFP